MMRNTNPQKTNCPGKKKNRKPTQVDVRNCCNNLLVVVVIFTLQGKLIMDIERTSAVSLMRTGLSCFMPFTLALFLQASNQVKPFFFFSSDFSVSLFLFLYHTHCITLSIPSSHPSKPLSLIPSLSLSFSLCLSLS